MWQAILTAVYDWRIRAVAIALLLLGFTFASTVTYQSMIGVNQLKIDERFYSIFIFATGVAGMIGNLTFGALSDFAKSRKTAVLACVAAGAFGYALFAIYPTVTTFLLCLLILSPISGSTYALLFGTVRSIVNEHGDGSAASVNAAVRAFYAVSWIVLPGLVGIWIGYTGRPSDSFAVAALAYVFCGLFYWRFGPDIAGGVSGGTSALQNLREATGLIFKRGRAERIVALSLANSASQLTYVILPLVFIGPMHQKESAVGWFAGLVAAAEIPLMIVVGEAVRRMQVWSIVVDGGFFYATFLLLLARADDRLGMMIAMIVVLAIGNAVVMTQHISYAQDLLPERPGLGTSLLSIVNLVGRGVAAIIFAGLSYVYGFTGALLTSCVLTLAGCLMLALLDGGKGISQGFNLA